MLKSRAFADTGVVGREGVGGGGADLGKEEVTTRTNEEAQQWYIIIIGPGENCHQEAGVHPNKNLASNKI